MGRKEDLNLVKEFARKISLIYPDSKVFFFGSRAKGNAKEHSDFDIIVVSEKFKKAKKFGRNSKLYDNWNYDYAVDFVCLTEKEFEKKKNQTSIIGQAIKEGIKIR